MRLFRHKIDLGESRDRKQFRHTAMDIAASALQQVSFPLVLTGKPLPAMDEQIQVVYEAIAKKARDEGFVFSDHEITKMAEDTVLLYQFGCSGL